MENRKSHIMRREERTRLVISQNKKCALEKADKIKKMVGDADIAKTFFYLIEKENFDIDSLLNKLKFIKGLFLDNGFSEEDAINFINRNKIILSINLDSIVASFNVLSNIFEQNIKSKKELMQFIYSQSSNRSFLLNSSIDMQNIVNLIIKIFKSKNYSEEEAYKFIYENLHILSNRYLDLIDILALLNKVSLDEELLFNKNKNIACDYPLYYLYDAIKTLPSDSINLEKIKELIDLNISLNEEPYHKLSNYMKMMLRSKYEYQLNRNINENYKQKRSL